MNRKEIKKIKIISILYSIRDSFSLTISKIPIKLGELAIVYEIISGINKKIYKPRSKSESLILLGLLLNLFSVIIVSLFNFNSIDHTFFLKFVFKNIFYFLFMLNIILTRKKINNESIKIMCKIIVLIQIPFFVLEYIFNIQVVGFSFIEPIQKITIGNIQIYRFVGSASEPAYIIPLLAMPLYYFTNNKEKNRFYLYLTLLFIFLTFSPFGYCILALNYLIFLKKLRKQKHIKYIQEVLILMLVFLILILVIINTQLKTYFNSMFNKMLGYITFEYAGKMDWSAMDRSQHIRYAIELFKSSSFKNIIFGNGTGFYYFNSLNNPNLYINNVEEAYNLYLSTLVDRGLLGFVLLIAIFVSILNIKTNDSISKAIKFGIIVQFIHYGLVGNMWLYFLWFQVSMLICYNNNLERNEFKC